MRLLHWVLAPEAALEDAHFPKEWGAPPKRLPISSKISFSVLYSDIGEEFYLNCGPTPDMPGWEVISPLETVFEINTIRNGLASELVDASHLLEWLHEKEAVQIWEMDSLQMKESFSLSPVSSAHRICILPKGGVAAYLNRRVTEVSPGSSDVPKDQRQEISWGVRYVEENRRESLHFASWAPDPQAPTSTTLAITRLRTSKDSFPVLLKAVCEYAASHNPQYERLEIWNLPDDLSEIAGRFGGKVVRRSEHLNAMKVYGVGDKVDWLFNERYCWC